jgi:hypothetical protein
MVILILPRLIVVAATVTEATFRLAKRKKKLIRILYGLWLSTSCQHRVIVVTGTVTAAIAFYTDTL